MSVRHIVGHKEVAEIRLVIFEAIPMDLIDRRSSSVLRRRHEVCVDPEREARVRVPEVVRKGPDRLPGGEKDRCAPRAERRDTGGAPRLKAGPRGTRRQPADVLMRRRPQRVAVIR